MKVKIRLDTFSDAKRFSDITSMLPGQVLITDNKGLCVSAKSILGALYSLEFDELWCEAEEDIYRNIEEFIVIE